MGVPAMVVGVMFIYQGMICLYYAGHLGDPAIIAAIGLGNMSMNVLGLAILEPMNSAIETQVSQAAGRGNNDLCQIYLNRARVVLFFLLIPITYALLNCQKVYIIIG